MDCCDVVQDTLDTLDAGTISLVSGHNADISEAGLILADRLEGEVSREISTRDIITIRNL